MFKKCTSLLQKTVHHCAAVFVDNSGVDIVLGILPFVRALLLRGTAVILCANEWPALNDVTNVELEEILQGASHICPIISAALSTGDLVVRSSGQRGPCLDLRTISVGKLMNFIIVFIQQKRYQVITYFYLQDYALK